MTATFFLGFLSSAAISSFENFAAYTGSFSSPLLSLRRLLAPCAASLGNLLSAELRLNQLV